MDGGFCHLHLARVNVGARPSSGDIPERWPSREPTRPCAVYREGVLENEIWVVKHERYELPSYVRVYGPFKSGDEAAEWAAEADLPDFHVALRLVPPSELHKALAELHRKGQLTPDSRSLDEAGTSER